MVGILSRIKNIGSFYLYFLKVMITKFQNILLDGFLFILIFSFSCGHKNTIEFKEILQVDVFSYPAIGFGVDTQ